MSNTYDSKNEVFDACDAEIKENIHHTPVTLKIDELKQKLNEFYELYMAEYMTHLKDKSDDNQIKKLKLLDNQIKYFENVISILSKSNEPNEKQLEIAKFYATIGDIVIDPKNV